MIQRSLLTGWWWLVGTGVFVEDVQDLILEGIRPNKIAERFGITLEQVEECRNFWIPERN